MLLAVQQFFLSVLKHNAHKMNNNTNTYNLCLFKQSKSEVSDDDAVKSKSVHYIFFACRVLVISCGSGQRPADNTD